ncbi:potassium channel family protein [Actinomycetaceae bacterium WB03_NA08]|uniref:Potassium channel family protein n=1 Tax=Scrofimicrobium canadense TaxID=2652290 RepID=A0A6N7W3J9_9ACTO|nr:potassium channel family protein [Scrofimicrobium canadense]MSS83875.1 potassium channel family protein [Scrofimicrobium canadense]
MPQSTASDRALQGPRQLRKKLKQRYERWEQLTVWPMFILSIVFVGVSAYLIAAPSTMTAKLSYTLLLVMLILWSLFILDYFVRMVLSDNRWRFFQTQAFELVALLIPYLRPFLLIRYIWRLQFFRRHGAAGLRMRALISISLFALCYVYTISTLVFLFERVDPKANIVNWGDAMWWGFTTISTVGYGDFTPVTVTGRLLAICLMVGGIFIVGVTSATMISAFNDELKHYLHHHSGEKVKENEEKHDDGRILMDALSVGELETEYAKPTHLDSDSVKQAKSPQAES